MSRLAAAPLAEPLAPPGQRSPRWQEIVALVEALTTGPGVAGLTIHDRRSQRFEFVGPIVVQPLDDDGRPDGAPLFVEGRDLSAGGLSFRHEGPLHHRHVAVTFPFAESEGRGVVAELGWCRFNRDGVYCSGGRFVRTLPAVSLEVDGVEQHAES